MKYFVTVLFSALLLSFSLAAAEKSLKVPQLYGVRFTADGVPDEPFWKKAAVIDHLVRFRTTVQAEANTRILLCADQKNLYLALLCDEPGKVSAAGTSVWSGDRVEIFFGMTGKNDWYRQMAIALNGLFYNEFIRQEDYQLKIRQQEKFWSAEIAIPLDKLGKFVDNSFGFNILRYRTNIREAQSWSDLFWAHDVAKFGRLQLYTPAAEITHGPWTFGITASTAGVAWESAGKAEYEFFFRKAGMADFRKTAVTEKENIHHVFLRDLEPGTRYEYRTGDGEVKSFTTLSPAPADFSFAFVSDIHCRTDSLLRMMGMPELKKADMLFCLGDMTTAITGRNAIYDSFLDVAAANWPKPLYAVRGNHEYRGNAPECVLDIFSPHDRRSYGAFSHKGIFFLLLDSGGDAPDKTDYVKKQKEFLQKAVRSKEFSAAEFRVVMTHHPLFDAVSGGGEQAVELFSSLPLEVQKSFDLCLSGHVHSYNRLLPGEKVIFSNNAARNGKMAELSWTFPVLTSDSDGVIAVEKSGRVLKVTVIDGKGSEIDRLELKQR
ncbi:MAG: hypothetical protein E7057_10215 [Lentisphaerae bacterium]|nr:hypothetical protein [Lentisphaerota bacterium]